MIGAHNLGKAGFQYIGRQISTKVLRAEPSIRSASSIDENRKFYNADAGLSPAVGSTLGDADKMPNRKRKTKREWGCEVDDGRVNELLYFGHVAFDTD